MRAASGALRLLGPARTTLRARPLAAAGSLLARLGLIEAVAVWPDALHPTIALNLNDPTVGSWMEPMLPSRARRLHIDARSWQAVRASALVLLNARSPLIPVVERVLGRRLNKPRVSLYSPTGCRGKLTLFVGEAGETYPTAVVKTMAREANAWWLAREVENLRVVRSLLGDGTREALLPPPLFAGEVGGEYLVVERYCRLEHWGDRSPLTRARAHRWLREFQRVTVGEQRRWREADTHAAVASVRRAWGLLRPESAHDVASFVDDALQRLRGAAHVRCATHGDFSPCNLAEEAGRLKVIDWEWSKSDGFPSFDLWSYQLADVQWRSANGETEGFDRGLSEALAFVEHELAIADLDPRFALATLPVVLAELVIRLRRTLGARSLWEVPGGELMAATERLISR